MMKSFVYCWTDHKKQKLYIGYHKGDPNDGYVCSSKHMMAAYKKRPADFTRQIIASGSAEDMMRFERTLLKAVDAKNDPAYYNLSNGNLLPIGNTKKNRTPWNKGKKGAQVAWNKGKKGAQVAWNKGAKGVMVPWNKGKKGAQISWNKGLPKEQQPRFGKVSGMKGKKQSAKHAEVIRQILKTNNPMHKKLQCPHCDYVGPKIRWHWDNCKKKGG